MLREIIHSNPAVKKRDLLSFSAHFKLDLPVSYQKFLLKHNGGQPIPAAFLIQGFPNNPEGVLQVFFGLNATAPTEDLEIIMAELDDNLPDGILPIACTDGYDFVCLDLRFGGESVVFWDRKPFWGADFWCEDDLYPVAPDFDSLLGELFDSSY